MPTVEPNVGTVAVVVGPFSPMSQDRITIPAYVIKAVELPALNNLASDYPPPQALAWIDRGLDARLPRTSIEMLIRTIVHNSTSPSVQRLFQSAGLRVIFRSDADRQKSATLFNRTLTPRAQEELRANAGPRGGLSSTSAALMTIVSASF